jgi:two-component system chemotaxis response regulator CheY
MRQTVEKYLAVKQFTLVGTAADGETAVRLFALHLPDVVTLDITMKKMDGLKCLDTMLSLKPDTKILLISDVNDTVKVIQALKKGAQGFLPKPFTAEQLQIEMDEVLKS